MVTNSRQLNFWMRYHPNFKGVFARDEFIVLARPTGCFIVNTDTSNLRGIHWIAINICDGRSYYFDPAGGIPMRDICRVLTGTILSNTTHYQKLSRSNCGQHCVYFLYHDTPARNDNIAKSFINKHLL